MKAVLLALAVAGLASCTTFGSSNDADAGVDASTSCWPNGTCPSNEVCCVAADGTGTCTTVSQCPSDHASLSCLRQSDCPSGFCCEESTLVMDGGSTVYYPRAGCSSTDCPKGGGRYRLCDGPSDCASGMSCVAQPKYVPTRLGICE